MTHEAKLDVLMQRVHRNADDFTPTHVVSSDGKVVANRFKGGKGGKLEDFLYEAARKTPADKLNDVFLVEEGEPVV